MHESSAPDPRDEAPPTDDPLLPYRVLATASDGERCPTCGASLAGPFVHVCTHVRVVLPDYPGFVLLVPNGSRLEDVVAALDAYRRGVAVELAQSPARRGR